MKHVGRIYMAIIFGIMYFPLCIMVLFSFNSSVSTSSFKGFSLHWYEELFYNVDAMEALKNSLILAVCTTIIATLLGTIAAVGIYNLRRKWVKNSILSVTNIPMMSPEIVTGVSLMLLFAFVGKLFSAKESLGFATMLLAHVTFCLPYVVLNVLPKLNQTDPHLSEAAQDLGNTPFQAFMKVILPSISPGIVSGAIMAFTLSIDDFVISNFTSGGFVTLPIYIYSKTKKFVKPDMYALCTLMLVHVLLLIMNVSSDKQVAKEKNVSKRKKTKIKG